MGYYLTKTPRTPAVPKCYQAPKRPSLKTMRAMLVRAKEISFVITWLRNGRPEVDRKRAQRLLKFWGKEICCACDVCDVYTRGTLEALQWACGERETL